MQLSTLALALATLAAPALGHPATLNARQEADACTGLGDGALASFPGLVTLAALNTTLPNANATGAPLTINLDTPGGRGPGDTYALSTGYSVGHLNSPGVNLTDNKMFDDRGHGDGGVSVVNLVTFHSLATYANSAAIYCAAPPKEEGGLRQLAIYGRTDLFQLCSRWALGKTVQLLYYNSTAADCIPVEVQIVEQ